MDEACSVPLHGNGEMALKHVLAVDDDAAMRGLIADYLGAHDFRVSTAIDGRTMAKIVADSAVDLVVLDLKLADEDGLKVLRELRVSNDVPVIVVTGQRRDEVDRIVGLELGADDYLTKPFNPRELLARIRAVLRRVEKAADRRSRKDKAERYRFAGFELDAQTRRITSPDGRVVPLSRGELSLMLAFLHAPQRILTREHLLNASHMHDDDVFDRSIDVQILRLRRKLETNPSMPALIKTERGAGYILDAPVTRA
jgi:two-component system OmpR family response regulator